MTTANGQAPGAGPNGHPPPDVIERIAKGFYETGFSNRTAELPPAPLPPAPLPPAPLPPAPAPRAFGGAVMAPPLEVVPPALDLVHDEGITTFDSPAYYFLPEPPPEPPAAPEAPQTGVGARLAAARRDFPALHQSVNGKPLVWLDNAATTHKPQVVIDTVARFYEHDNSNVHRGAHALAKRATEAYEEARGKVRAFIGAGSPEEIVWVRGATEGINLVAQTYGRRFVGRGDEVIVTTLEHHSNIVPWQMLCEANEAQLRVVPVSDGGELLLDEYAKLLSSRTRLVAVTAVSNVIGTVTPLPSIVGMAHAVGAKVLVDGAQAVQHMPVNVGALDADFFVLSGHKLFGPTGIGALYGKRELLEQMPPWQGGGSMIDRVAFEKTTYAAVPAKFEAGTGHLAGAVGLGAAIDYMQSLGLETIAAHEQQLMAHATESLAGVPGLRHLAAGPGRMSALPFTIPGVPAERIGAFLDREGIAVRAGHHCAQPLLRRFGLEAAVRASVALYNTREEIDALVTALRAGVAKGWE